MERMSAFTPSRRRLYAALPAIVVILVGIAAFVEFKRMDLMRQWAAHTAQVIGVSRGLGRDLAEAESAQRGYLLAGEDVYLPPYTQALGRVSADAASLRTLTRDNRSQRLRLDTLSHLMARRVTLLRHLVEVRRGGGLSMVSTEM
ncbi:MAG TPA: CHASE3 domain-containing protein, partial [Longimicrobiales bacterium]